MRLVIERGKIIPFDALPPRSIALDGYVQGPGIDAERECYSFDHHAGCIRHATRATSEQVRDAILLGLDARNFTIFANDVDLDTALSVWLLANPHRVQELAVRTLVTAAGLLDAHFGAYPVEDELRSVIEWLSEPETRARAEGSYWSMDDRGLEKLLGDISRRVDVWTHGEANADVREFEVDERYVVEREGTGWIVARTVGTRAHAALFRDGHMRVLIYRVLPDGSYGYTVAKRSEFVKHFPIDRILAELAKHEPGWGGGSTIGGAPRHRNGSRSKLEPDTVFSVIEALVQGSLHPNTSLG